MIPTKDDLKALPVFAPLIAAVIAPLSTLYDIPALTEPWFFHQQHDAGGLTKLTDPRTNIALSAVGLAFNVFANALLVVRFSVTDGVWRYSTSASLGCWMVKFGIALGNILAYGILSRNTPGISYGEGFWCAFISLLLVLIIVVLLLCHYMCLVRGRKRQSISENQIRVQVAGRHFMLQTTLFVLTIGLLALFMSRVEHWTYLQGIYFSIVATLTVGFGDFYPTKPSSQIVLFPFVLVGIVQLASIVNLLVRFFQGRLASRRIERRRAFEQRRQEEENRLEKEPNLEQELLFLQKLYDETDKWKTAQDLATNCTAFSLFWVIGALIFSQIESWTYGQGLYFCYVFFLTIGFGDYAPITPAGRVVFVLYSIIAVPIMASFAVQTIQSIFQKLSSDRLRRNEVKAGLGEGAMDEPARWRNTDTEDACDQEKEPAHDMQEQIRGSKGASKYRTHTDFVMKEHDWIESQLLNSGRDKSKSGGANGNAEGPGECETERIWGEDQILVEHILELAVELEKHARRLLLGHMTEGSNARMLLKADCIVQLRNIRALAVQEQSYPDGVQRADDSSGGQSPCPPTDKGGNKSKVSKMMQDYYEEEAELVPYPTDLDEQETLEEITRYREAFAGLLAAGSRLLRLENEEKFLFERRYWRDRGSEG